MPDFRNHAALAAHAVRDHLGEPVVFEPVSSEPGGDARNVQAYFDDAAQEEDLNGNMPSIVTVPTLQLAQSDFPVPPKHMDRVTARGVVYEIWTVEADGADGSWDCRLKRA